MPVDNKKGSVHLLIIVFIASIGVAVLKRKGKIKVLTSETNFYIFFKSRICCRNSLRSSDEDLVLSLARAWRLIPYLGNKILRSAGGLGCRAGVVTENVQRVIISPSEALFFRQGGYPDNLVSITY